MARRGMRDCIIRCLRSARLIEKSPGVTAQQLAEYTETTVRTVYRDLARLQEAGYPIYSIGKGEGYGTLDTNKLLQ